MMAGYCLMSTLGIAGGISMQYQPLGSGSGIEVSRLAIGGLTFGSKLIGDQAERALHEAVDHGVNLFDTAESYNDGESERIIGSALTSKRGRVFLATKVYTPRAGAGRTSRNSRANLIESLEGSLHRLRTDHVDLYQLHHPDPRTPYEETFAALDRMVKDGKVRYIGICNHYGWQMGFLLSELRRRNWTVFVSCQHGYNILDRQVEMEIIPFCRKFGRALMAYEPFALGLLSGIYKPGQPPPPGARDSSRIRGYLADPAVQHLLEQLPSLAQRSGLTMNQLAILWLLSRPEVSCAILGGDCPEHFSSIYQVIDRTLTPEMVQEIDRLSAMRIHLPFPNQPCIEGPGI